MRIYYKMSGLCPEKFVFFLRSWSCYKAEYGAWNWNDARQHCNNMGNTTYPAVIQTQEQAMSIANYVPYLTSKYLTAKSIFIALMNN